jgi:diguanylate cyclase (GGDEF)-like protein
VTRHWLGRGVPLSKLFSPLGWVAFVDTALAPVALVVAFVAVKEPLVILSALPLGLLLHALGSERRRRIDEGLVLGRAVEDAARAARSDPLTGVGNRLAWQEAFELAERERMEHPVPTSVLLVDLNGLKDTNDTHGHDLGDRLIQALASTLHRALPEGAELARIGGDEFAILAVGTDSRSCDELVFHIRRDLAELTVKGIPVQASIGAAASPPSPSLEAALRLADERLYAGKRAVEA